MKESTEDFSVSRREAHGTAEAELAGINDLIEENRLFLGEIINRKEEMLLNKDIPQTEKDGLLAQIEVHVQLVESANRELENLKAQFKKITGNLKNFHREGKKLLGTLREKHDN